jgi:hypothetical protein
MIKPTVGRMVWFYPQGPLPPGFIYHDIKQPCAAQVAYVAPNETELNLLVLDQNAIAHPVTQVPLVQEGEPKPEGQSFCAWMPYQIGQAKQQSAAAPVALPVGPVVAEPAS